MRFKMNVNTNYLGTVLIQGNEYESGKLQIPDEIIDRWSSRGLIQVEKINTNETKVPAASPEAPEAKPQKIKKTRDRSSNKKRK